MPEQRTQEELKAVLEEFGHDKVEQVLKELSEGTFCQKSISDFADPGKEVDVGHDCRIAPEEMTEFERVVGVANFLPAHFLEEGALVQRAVARVTLTEGYVGLPAGSGWGTGFLVSPSLFMTNNHVIPTIQFARKVEMQFNFQLDHRGNPLTTDAYDPDPDRVFYTNSLLDFTLLRLAGDCRWIIPPDPPPYPPLPPLPPWPDDPFPPGPFPPGPFPPGPESHVLPPRVTQPWRDLLMPWRYCTTPGSKWGRLQLRDGLSLATDQHLNIVQHPQGRRKEVALQKNQIKNIYPNAVRYTTDTEPGSSGSAVFNNEWDLVAIHHAAGEPGPGNTWVSNEGMRIDKIVADLRDHYGATASGSQILAELGI